MRNISQKLPTLALVSCADCGLTLKLMSDVNAKLSDLSATWMLDCGSRNTRLWKQKFQKPPDEQMKNRDRQGYKTGEWNGVASNPLKWPSLAQWRCAQILRPGFNPDLGCGLCEICTFSCSHASSRNWLQFPPTFQRQAGWQVNGPLWIAPSMDRRIWGSWLLCHSCANFSVTYSVVCGDGMTIINSIGRMDVILLHHKETWF